MTQQFENFVNAALDKSLASDVTLPTANEIPVYTGIGRQVTGKTTAELGLAALVDGKVPASQLPSYVDDVLEYPNLASFPVTGESGKVYVALDTNKTYRWSGSTYVVIGSDLALGETLSTAYRGDRGKTAYDHSQATGNPHGATTADITDSTDKRYVTDAQRTRVNTAASSSDDGYLTSTDWSTFNSKQAALADVITENTYGSSTQWPAITFNAKGIATGVTLHSPTFTDATFAVQKNGSPSIAASWDLTALTDSYVHTYPDKDIDFKTLSSIGASDGNTLSGTRNRILGGSNTTVDGTDNIAIGCKSFVMLGTAYTSCTMIDSNASMLVATKNIMLGMRSSYMQTDPVSGSLFLGASDNHDLFTYPVAAATVMNSLFASSDSVPVSGTLYASLDGSQTLSAANCLPIPTSGGTAQYEVDFIVSVGTVGLASTACNATGCIVMRRIFTVFRLNSTTAYISAVDTVGTDRTLGTIAGTFTPTIALSGNTHVTVGITRAGGVAGQEAMAISARVRSHLTR